MACRTPEIRNRRIPALLLALLVLGAVLTAGPTGCDLTSVTLLIRLESPGAFRAADALPGVIGIDLSDDHDFKKHKDRIKSVDEVGFVFTVQNARSTPSTAEIWFSRDLILPPTRAAVRTHALSLLRGLEIPGSGSVDVSYQESLSLLVPDNTETFHETVRDGTIFLYAMAAETPYDLTVEGLTLVAVVTAGL